MPDPNSDFDAVWGGSPIPKSAPHPVQAAAADSTFVRPPLKNAGDILGFQQASVIEAIFHKHDQDANMQALREALGIQKFYAQNPAAAHTIFGPVIDHFIDNVQGGLTNLGRGTIDVGLETGTDPLTAETFGVGGLAKNVAVKAGTPIVRGLASVGKRILPEAVKGALTEGRTVANAIGQGWYHLTQYAPEAKLAHGLPRVRASIAAGSRQARRYEELNRRLQGIADKSVAGLSKDEISHVQQAMNGQFSPSRLTTNERTAFEIRRGLTRVVAPVMQHLPGGGSIAASSTFKAVGEKGAVRGTIKVEPKLENLTVPQLRRQLFGKLKAQGISPEDRAASIQQVLGKKTLTGASKDDLVKLMRHYDVTPKPQTGSRLLNRGYAEKGPETTPVTANESLEDWIARLKSETAATMRTHGTPPQLHQDLGVPIEKEPSYVKGPFGKMQRAPIVKPQRKFVGQAFEMQKPEVPQELQEFAGTPGEFTASNVRADYHPGQHYRKEMQPRTEKQKTNLLEGHNPHLITQDPMFIRSRQVDDYEQAFRGMLKTSARHITVNELKVKLGQIWGIKPSEVEKSLPREVSDLFTKTSPADWRGLIKAKPGEASKVAQEHWPQILSDAWRGLVNLPKAAVVGASPFHMFNIGAMLGVNDAGAFPEALVNFGRAVRAGGDPAARWDALGREAAEYGLGTPLEDAHGWTTKVPGMRQMNQWTWEWDTAASLAMAKRLVRKEGLKPLEAGQKARERLVDYDHRALSQQAARYVAPFSQYATASPGVITRGLARTPLASETLNRATGGKLLGGGDQQSGVYYGPSAKVGRMFNVDAALDPGYTGNRIPGVTKYATGALTEPARAALRLTGVRDPQNATEAVTSMLPIPYARSAVEAAGLGAFQNTSPLGEAIFSSTGYSPGADFGKVNWNTPVSSPEKKVDPDAAFNAVWGTANP